MSQRLIGLRQIQAEKINRSRSWIFAEIAAGRFPKPLGGTGPNLWEEETVDQWLDAFIAAAKHRAALEEEARKKAVGRRLVEARLRKERALTPDPHSIAA